MKSWLQPCRARCSGSWTGREFSEPRVFVTCEVCVVPRGRSQARIVGERVRLAAWTAILRTWGL